ncbi:hypothetical protein Thi970DRAFT_03921 [Thiorhodovibrio frisius]|uniref:Uncharacterized protein n=2 Tax=Thiorhodovibrio frisius TaxID=631362 RepID=H8Z4N8_9GAMM|nr:hypothetical protein Thi970DRAFT_03921 [Thiorhodovibrio frisius]WPL21033.1 hypothetical protein Thiofri_01140 [Thiorhodovibrio frisius]
MAFLAFAQQLLLRIGHSDVPARSAHGFTSRAHFRVILGAVSDCADRRAIRYTFLMVNEVPDNPDKEPQRQWHRAFGIALVDVFAGAPWRVELEQELALTSQELDVAIIEAAEEGRKAYLPDPLPDGLENLCAINLLSYKSRHEALDVWSLDELIGYYVIYRKVKLNPDNARHPLDAFGLYAVATRFPRALSQADRLEPTAWQGVYDLPWGGHRVRMIVLNQIAKHPRNAPWELFSSQQDRMRQGLERYRARPRERNERGYWKLLERFT